jgi:uncharacterized protein (TIGR01619 family)
MTTSSEQVANNSTHEQEWDFYFSNVDDIIGSFYLDLGLTHVAPIENKPNLVWISLQMNNPREDGLSSGEEFELLTAIEDRLQELVPLKHNTIYVGRLTTDGRRDFYFYMGDTTFYDKTISEVMVAFPTYSYDFGIKQDPQWEQYFNFMYPNPRQLQSILNRRVIDNLEEQGDSLTKARLVDHWIHFKTDSDRNLFVKKIEHLNFNVISKTETTSFEGYPYELNIDRLDKVDHNSVDNYVLELWQLAEECNGEYDGWGCLAEKD